MNFQNLVRCAAASLIILLPFGAHAANTGTTSVSEDAMESAGERIRQTGAQLQADIKKARARLEAEQAKAEANRKREAERARQQAIQEAKQRQAQEAAQARARQEAAARAEQAPEKR